MERTNQEKFVTLYDTAKKCLLILDVLYRRIEEGTRLMAGQDGSALEEGPVIELYIAVLSFVDYLHRFHEIVCGMPLLRKDLPEMKRLRTAFVPIKECRNYLQHMRGDLMGRGALRFPVLGAISWIADNRNYILLPGQPLQPYETPGIAYDRQEGRFVCKYQLSVGGHDVNLDIAYEEAKFFWAWLDSRTVIQPDRFKVYSWGLPAIFHVEMKEGGGAR